MFYTRLVTVTLGTLTLAAHAEAGSLYATSAAGSTGELYLIDNATGALVQDIGPLNSVTGLNYPITGLAFNPTTNVLYGSTGNSEAATAAQLVTINRTTGLVTPIGSFNTGVANGSGTPSTMGDLSFDPTTGTLYGVATISGPQLYSINPATGQATLIGGTGLTSTTGGGIAVSSAGTFNGTPTSTRFGTYNNVTGAFTNIAAPTRPVGGGYAALEYGAGGVLYGLNLGAAVAGIPPTHLVTIDPATGAVTDLGASVDFLDAIAYVPEPTSLMALGAAGLLVARRRNG
jgi:hypothetical protein